MKKIILALTLLLFVSFEGLAQVTAPDLGNATSFTVLAGTQVVNTSNTEVEGNLGVFSGNTFTGSETLTLKNGASFLGNAVAEAAQTDLTKTYQDLVARPPMAGKNLSGQNLGGKT